MWWQKKRSKYSKCETASNLALKREIFENIFSIGVNPPVILIEILTALYIVWCMNVIKRCLPGRGNSFVNNLAMRVLTEYQRNRDGKTIKIKVCTVLLQTHSTVWKPGYLLSEKQQ